MPELPEVETIRLGLRKVILNKKITNFEVRDLKVVQFAPEQIIGSRIEEIERRAKILIFKLDNKKSILTHLKMTGQLIWEECSGEKDFCLKKSRVSGGHPSADWVNKLPSAHTRAIFGFEDESVLFFNDLRRFGYMKLYETSELDQLTELKKLGPEPFGDKFTTQYLEERAKKVPNRKVKQFITDQEIISGVGNIYVDEALFEAGISPLRAVSEITTIEWGKIRESIRRALERGIKYGGSSEDTYVDAFGNAGTMSAHMKVYRRTGLPCENNCGGEVKRIVLGGRGTHYCPNCQG